MKLNIFNNSKRPCAHILATPEFTKTFIMESDVLGNGIGAILMQEEHPLAFKIHPIKGNNLKGPFMRRTCWQYYIP